MSAEEKASLMEAIGSGFVWDSSAGGVEMHLRDPEVSTGPREELPFSQELAQKILALRK